jgi:uncharacterized protein with HEPN domain
MRSEDIIRVRHMLDAAREASAFVADKTRSDLDQDRLLALGLMKCIEIIGEASAKISKVFRQAHQEISWGDIIGMRNRLIHAYADVDTDVLWNTVMEDLPCLIDALEEILEMETR